MQRLVWSQQSVTLWHFSATLEHVLAGGGTHASMGTPSADRLVSRQKPLQQSLPDSQVSLSALHGASAANARMLPASISCPGRKSAGWLGSGLEAWSMSMASIQSFLRKLGLASVPHALGPLGLVLVGEMVLPYTRRLV